MNPLNSATDSSSVSNSCSSSITFIFFLRRADNLFLATAEMRLNLFLCLVPSRFSLAFWQVTISKFSTGLVFQSSVSLVFLLVKQRVIFYFELTSMSSFWPRSGGLSKSESDGAMLGGARTESRLERFGFLKNFRRLLRGVSRLQSEVIKRVNFRVKPGAPFSVFILVAFIIRVLCFFALGAVFGVGAGSPWRRSTCSTSPTPPPRRLLPHRRRLSSRPPRSAPKRHSVRRALKIVSHESNLQSQLTPHQLISCFLKVE